jgi:hypothetical protein
MSLIVSIKLQNIELQPHAMKTKQHGRERNPSQNGEHEK